MKEVYELRAEIKDHNQRLTTIKLILFDNKDPLNEFTNNDQENNNFYHYQYPPNKYDDIEMNDVNNNAQTSNSDPRSQSTFKDSEDTDNENYDNYNNKENSNCLSRNTRSAKKKIKILYTTDDNTISNENKTNETDNLNKEMLKAIFQKISSFQKENQII